MSTAPETTPEDTLQLLQQAARIAQIGYCVYDIGSEVYISVSEQYAQIFGCTADQFMASFRALEEDMALVHSEDREELAQAYDNAYESRETLDIEYRIVRTDGCIRYVHEISEYIYDDAGTPVRELCTLQDITERRLADEKIRSYAARFEKWKESNFIGVIHSNAEGKILDANTALLAMLGYSQQDLLENCIDWTRLTPPEFLHLDKQAMEEAAVRGSWTPFEKEYFHKEGHRVPIAIGGSVLSEDTREYIVFVVDLSERKKAEEALRKYDHIVSNSSDLLALMDRNFVYETVNTAYLEQFNLELEQLIGHTPSEVFGDQIFKTVIEPKAKRCLEGDVVRFRNWIRLPGRGKRFMDIVYSPYYDLEGTIQGIVVGQRDVTEQYELEEELLTARKLESIGLLAGGIAHDFNNVLAGLFGNIELAQRKLQPEHEAYANIQTAGQALKKASGMTQQLLTFAKGGDPIIEATDVAQVIQDSVQFSLSGSNVTTVINLPDDLWQVRADQGQLSQVLTNLTVNADHAMPNGGTLTIEARNVGATDSQMAPFLSGDFIELSIRDEGIGISAEHIGKIFDPYFTTKQTGSGLGLASVHSIIAKHSGRISVDSTLGSSTTFTLQLPAETSSTQCADEVTSNTTTNANSASGRILVMDDDEMIRDLSVSLLQSFGYATDTAVNGEEALEKYSAASKVGEPFDLVIMDLTIPGGLGGRDTAERLLAADPEARAIVSSGYSTDPVMAHYSDYGFKGRLVKPFRIAELEKEVARVMEAL
ncbi:MAG: PAS domain S-box protein [Halieaceae bacterium]|jgi:PAS domain S-box-containing protein|nr:PAS domain S-box protein [Halieaceae bacterium]